MYEQETVDNLEDKDSEQYMFSYLLFGQSTYI